MIDITARQIQILRALIEEYINTAEPVGSDTIDRKFNIGVSPATIRNEMVYLTKQGYLRKNHTSAGRMPTPLAMRLYVNELMKEKELSVADEVSAKEKVWENRKQAYDLMQIITRVLADRTHSLGIALTDNRNVFHAGYANLLNMPEFYDIDVMRHVLSLIEETSLLQEIFDYGTSENLIKVVFGSELGNKFLSPLCVVYMTIETPDRKMNIGVLGSPRFDYSYVIPMMKYLNGLVQELALTQQDI